VKFVKIYLEMTFLLKYGFGWLYRIFFYMWQYFHNILMKSFLSRFSSLSDFHEIFSIKFRIKYSFFA
jgi:hypothetical protein